MAVTTKKTFNAVGSGGQGTTVFTPVSIELNNQDDLDVYVTKTSAGISANNNLRIKHYRQNSTSNLDANHDQVNDTTGLYFPALTHTGGTETLQNYTLSADNNTITFNSALPTGAVVSIERRTRDSSSDYTNFAGGSTIRSTQLNDAFDESNFTAQEARNKAFEIEGKIFGTGATSTSFITSDEIVDGTIVGGDIAANTITASNLAANSVAASELADDAVDTDAIQDNAVTMAKLNSGVLPTDITVASANIVDGTIVNADINNSAAIAGTKLADDSVTLAKLGSGALPTDITVASSNIVNGTIVDADVSSGAAIAHTKLAGAAASKVLLGNSSNVVTATTLSGDVTVNSSGVTAITAGSIVDADIASTTITGGKLVNDTITATQIGPNAITASELADDAVDRNAILNDAVNGDKIDANSIDSDHYVDGSIDHVHLNTDIIDGDNIEDNAIGSEHITSNAVTDSEIATGTLDNRYYTETELNAGQLDNRYYTETELNAGQLDTRYYTETESDARYFNVSTGDTIKDGQTFPDNDTTIATTAAINDRIIDLVDDVGGFVPLANETSFPTANPDVNNGTGTIVSIGSLASNHTSNGSGVVTITNGAGSGNNVTITGLANNTTYSAGYGMLLETTTTSGNGSATPPRAYTFHRLSSKATEVTTVAGSISSVNTVAGAISNVNAVAGNATNINAVAADATDIGAVAGKATEIGRLGTADAVSDLNTLGTTAIVSDLDTLADISSNITTVAGISGNVTTVAGIQANVTTVAGIQANVTTVAGNNSNVTTVAGNISDVNNFADLYQIDDFTSTPNTDGGGNALAEGDLAFNTTANELKIWNGSSWQGGVTASGNFASTTGNTFTGNNIYNDGVHAKFGTGSDFYIKHDGTNNLTELATANAHNVWIKNYGGGANEAMAGFRANGATELYYDGSKKFETTSAGVDVTGTLTIDAVPGANTNAALPVLFQKTDGVIDGGSGLTYNPSQDTFSVNGNHISINTFRGNGNLGELTCSNHSSTTKVSVSNTIDITTVDNTAGAFTLKQGSNEYITVDTTNSSELIKFGTAGTTRMTIAGANIDLPDNQKIRLGTGNDLQIYHSSGTNYINYANGNLIFKNGTESDANCTQFDGNGDLYVPDNGIVYFGSNPDLKLYHNSSNNNSYIEENGTGNLIIASSQTQIVNAAQTELCARFDGDGAVELYYDGTKKFNTTSTGATISGTNPFLEISGSAGTSGDTGIFINANANHWLVKADNYSSGNQFQIKHGDTSSSETAIACVQNAEVQLYYNNRLTCKTNSNGIRVESPDGEATLVVRGFEGNAATLQFDADEGDDASDYFRLRNHGNNTIGLQNYHGSSWETNLLATGGGATELYYDNVKKLDTTAAGVNMRHTVNIYGATGGSNANLRLQCTGGAVYNTLEFTNAAGNSSSSITGYSGASILFLNSNEFVFSSSGAERWMSNSTYLSPRSDAGLDLGSSSRRWGDVYIKDSKKIKLGDGADLQIYASGSNSIIAHNGDGNLQITTGASGEDILVQAYGDIDLKPANGENGVKIIGNGATSLYYDNSKKFETASSGVQVSGSEWISEGTIYLEKSGVHHHRIIANDTGNDLAFQQSSDTGANTNFTSYLRIKDGGDIHLPVDGKKLLLGAGNDLQIYHDGSDSYVNNSTGDLKIRTPGPMYFYNNWNNEYYAKFKPNDSLDFYYDASHKFSTASTGLTIKGHNDIRLENGNWTGNTSSPKIQAHSNALYICGGSEGIMFRENGSDRCWIDGDGHLRPATNNSYDLGTSSYRWRNIYTNDLNLSNEGSANEVDGTWGKYTIQEGEDDLFLINKRNGKKYKFNLTEVS